ncbi:hypothetical protein QE435_001244 [Rhizobium sp. SORGH_AS 787]|nr:hypothetical protein [Rhizobium sp. SORGH_AS_0787]
MSLSASVNDSSPSPLRLLEKPLASGMSREVYALPGTWSRYTRRYRRAATSRTSGCYTWCDDSTRPSSLCGARYESMSVSLTKALEPRAISSILLASFSPRGARASL